MITTAFTMPVPSKLNISVPHLRPGDDGEGKDSRVHGGLYSNNNNTYKLMADETDYPQTAEKTHKSHDHRPRRRCPPIVVFCAISYGLLCFAYSLVMRLYLQAFYCSSYIAGWSVIMALFIISHHVMKLENALGCQNRSFSTYQIVINAFFMTCTIFKGAGYVSLTAVSIHINYDYAIAATLSFVNGLIMLYLCMVSIIAARGDRYSMYSVNRGSFVWTTHTELNNGSAYELQDLPSNGHAVHGNGAVNGDTIHFDDQSESCSKSECCRSFCSKFYHCVASILYYPRIFLMLMVMVLSTCYPYFVLSDTLMYRDTDSMYTVKVPGHNPLALFMKCRGTGKPTLVYENGLGGLAYMQWDFLPRLLRENYTVCVHDRRGYGWSEGYEHDNIRTLWTQPQWSKINSEFFIKLVEKANISTPFYYLGHSYGGSHLMYTLKQRPDIIKGLVFLDSVAFDAVETLRKYMRVIVNFQPSGLLYILLKTGVVDYKEAFKSVGDFSSISDYTSQLLISGIRSGTYIESYLREWSPLKDKSSPYYTHPSIIAERNVNKPTLVIDKDGRNSSWFPSNNFTQYNQSFYMQVPNSTHTTLVYSMHLTPITAQLIDNFVQYCEHKQSFTQYLHFKQDIISNNDNIESSGKITSSGDIDGSGDVENSGEVSTKLSVETEHSGEVSTVSVETELSGEVSTRASSETEHSGEVSTRASGETEISGELSSSVFGQFTTEFNTNKQ